MLCHYSVRRECCPKERECQIFHLKLYRVSNDRKNKEEVNEDELRKKIEMEVKEKFEKEKFVKADKEKREAGKKDNKKAN